MIKHTKHLLTLALITLAFVGVLFAPAITHAQGPDIIQAEVDRTNLSTDESLVMTVTINAASGRPSQPVLPPMAGLQIVGQSSGTSIQIVNGDITTQMTYQYRLQPTQAGDFVIEPISTTVNGQTFSTQPIVISVSQGSGATQAAPGLNRQTATATETPTDLSGQDFFVEAEVDNPNPYQGEQILHTFRFYQAVNIAGRTEYGQPAFTGFWHDQEAEQSEHYAEAAGRTYLVTELVTPLFPTLAGELVIDPASITVPVGFFSQGRTLTTQPVAVNVQPLPQGAPASYGGAVGEFDIQAEADRASTTVGDTINLRVTLSGRGNIDSAADPQFPASGQWRMFDSEPATQTWYDDGQLAGIRTYDWVLVPTEAGQLTLPAIEYSYFNPETETYHTINTDPIPVDVTADANAVAPLIPASNSGSNNGLTPTNIANSTDSTALRPLKDVTGKLATASQPLPLRPGYWLLWLIPVGLVAGQVTWQRRQRHLHDNADAIRSKQAAKKAQQTLAQARKNPETAAKSAGWILNIYLADKLNRSVAGRTQSRLAEILREAGVQDELVGRVQDALTFGENSRYAPAGHGTATDDLLTETEQIVAELEKSLS